MSEWLFQMTDHHDERFWLYVERPDSHGTITVGIEEVYRKFLDPDEAEAMAAALTTAAAEARQIRARLEVERQERERLREECRRLGGHEWGGPAAFQAGDFACRRCGSQPETVAYVLGS